MFKKVNPKTCEKCPRRYDPAGCPCWIDETAGFMKTNTTTGEEAFITGCFYQVVPFLMVEVVKASNRPAAAVESIRNEIVHGLAQVTKVMRPERPDIVLMPKYRTKKIGSEQSRGEEHTD